jgi:hypothetical protein
VLTAVAFTVHSSKHVYLGSHTNAPSVV